jgi:hypothetical protein
MGATGKIGSPEGEKKAILIPVQYFNSFRNVTQPDLDKIPWHPDNLSARSGFKNKILSPDCSYNIVSKYFEK